MEDKQGQVNVSVANIYGDSNYRSEVVTQAILGEKFIVVSGNKDFSSIQLADGYTGWISNHQWVHPNENEYPVRKVRSHFIRIYEQADISSNYLRDATIGAALSICDAGQNWYQLILPDGIKGFTQSINFFDFPEKTRQGAVSLAKEFLGYPYHWGGRSPKGFDCSGLIQTVMGLLALSLPRDAWMQHRDGIMVSEDPLEARQGDLYFFAENGSKISHVGLSLGNGQLIHARGMVRINSLIREDENFSQNLRDCFVDIRTYFDKG
jgi:hypothetical protein